MMAPAELGSFTWSLPIHRQGSAGSSNSHYTEAQEPATPTEASPKPDHTKYQQTPEHIISSLLGDKQHEWNALTSKRGPLRLLDLPVDVLNLVIKEVTHTNDLVALALTHSALHKLTIPQIYSRFDIVWPDATTVAETRTGVDALTYGLATLVMGEEVFGESPTQQPQACSHCGHCDTPRPQDPAGHARDVAKKIKKRRGNYYAEFTKKFSLGNGPEDWIKEYLANTESGKMLGTLVALAIARMRSLETFSWDMPTGVLQDVWNSLASLGERDDGQSCKLKKIWVRWHNNSPLVEGKYLAEPLSHEPHAFWQSYSEMIRTASNRSKSANIDKRHKVERPSFSMLPPLRSINVLDIDECAYLDELSVLMSKSRHCLKELRLGIAEHAVCANWAYPWTDHELNQLADDKLSSIGNISALEKRLGGVLGILTGHCFDLKKELAAVNKTGGAETVQADAANASVTVTGPSSSTDKPVVSTATSLSLRPGRARFVEDLPPFTQDDASNDDSSRLDAFDVTSPTVLVEAKLKLEILAIERISLSIPVLSHVFDWTTLRDLTLLDCQFTAMFWTMLRRQYTPAADLEHPSRPIDPSQYPLRLRKIHTNTVTPILLAFLRETLGPNTLEVLFLQQSEYHLSKVTPEKIMTVIKRHRGSLRRILVDSSYRDETDHGSVRAEGWDRWQFDRLMINYISSGKMLKLRELGMATALKDWHYLLQRLPYMSQLRALYLTYLAKTATSFVSPEEGKELAFHVLDILTIRPEIELCYLAINTKCFEIIESRVKPSDLQLEDEVSRSQQPAVAPAVTTEDDGTEGEEEDDDEDGGAAEEEDEDEEEHESELEESLVSEEIESEGEEETSTRVKMNLREILFYDDKVAIFKARYGRL